MESKEYLLLRKRAFELVYSKSKSEMRYFSPIPNQPYWTHLLNVHNFLITKGEKDFEILIAAILHDIIEDYDVTFEYLEINFSPRIAKIVDLCSRKQGEAGDVFYKKILNNEDSAPAKIKISDRIDNILTNYCYSDLLSNKDKFKSKIEECEKYFVPISKKANLEKEFKYVLEYLIPHIF